jgi:hypothetical protein
MVDQCGLPDTCPGNDCNDVHLLVCPGTIQKSDVFLSPEDIASCNGNLDTEIFAGVSPRGAICIAWRFASNTALPSPRRLRLEGLCRPPAASLFGTEELSALALRRSRCQPSNKAGTNPRRSTSRTTFMLQLGSSRLGDTIAATGGSPKH